jgi:thiazole synthase
VFEGALKIGDKVFNSRLILGTGKYPDFELMRESFEVSGTEMVTVAIRRIDLNDTSGRSLLDPPNGHSYHLRTTHFKRFTHQLKIRILPRPV